MTRLFWEEQVPRYFGALICLVSGMVCIALGLGQIAAEPHSSKQSPIAPKKGAVTERSMSKHTQKLAKKLAEPRKNDPHSQKRSLSQLTNRP